jgi:hypothetical protein
MYIDFQEPVTKYPLSQQLSVCPMPAEFVLEIGKARSATTDTKCGIRLRMFVTLLALMIQTMVKQIELWLIDRLIPYARNPRMHSDTQIAQIAASIAQFGFNNPILVDTTNGIIAGHGRLLAARKLGLTEVPVIVLDHLTEAQKRAYIIADNQLALNAGWDEDLLRVELAALQHENFDVNLIGFEDEELSRLLATQDGVEGLTDEDAVPELEQTPISELGDLWILGVHRLLVGDAMDSDVVAKLMAGATGDLVFTAPPITSTTRGIPMST